MGTLKKLAHKIEADINFKEKKVSFKNYDHGRRFCSAVNKTFIAIKM